MRVGADETLAIAHVIDRRAKEILFRTYWSGSGWTDPRQRHTDPDDLAYAEARGLMFEPASFSHDECLAAILRLHEGMPLALPARAFVSSLSSRRLDWRSGLASYHLARLLAPHPYTPVECGRSFGPSGEVTHVSHTCGACRDANGGIIGSQDYDRVDLNVLNFERLKWGGVRHGRLEYTWLDLRELARTDAPEPNERDISILNDVLAVVAASEAGDTAGTLEKRLKPVMGGSKDERRILIEILACVGVLQPRSDDRPVHARSDWQYAACWRGEDGYSEAAARRYFTPYLSTRRAATPTE